MKSLTLLERAIEQQIRWLATTLRPGAILQYRGAALHFLNFLKRRFADVGRPDQLHRDPHLIAWMQQLAEHQPPLSPAYRARQLLCLRRLLECMADLPHPPRTGLIRSEDLPRADFRLPRPLSPEDDQLLQEALGAGQDLLANALLLQRGTGLRIGELVDLSRDCLHHITGEHWAIRVPVGKLHSERWVPADQNLRDVVAQISTLAPSQPDPQFLLPRPRGRLRLIADLRSKPGTTARLAGCSIRPVPHQLRHTYATDMIHRHVSLPGVMALLGHTTPRMTMRYILVTQSDLQREYLQAQTSHRYVTPALPAPPSTASADPASVLQAFRDALHLLDCSRQHLGYPTSLDALRRRFVKFLKAAERTYQDKIGSTLAR